MKRPRRNHSPAFKAKVALEALKGEKTIALDMAQSINERSDVRPLDDFISVVRILLVRLTALALAALTSQPAVATSSALAGAIASPDRYGAMAAVEILGAGGNAVDAAVATAFALAVTYPEAGNLGGGFMTLYVKGTPYFLDYRETAPGKATTNMYLGANGQVVAGLSTAGNLSVAVPGTVRGMAMAHQRFGKLGWARDLAPALRLAQHGFTVSPQLAEMRQQHEGRFRGVTNFDQYFAHMLVAHRFQQPELAATLKRIAQSGDSDFYAGETAELLVHQMTRGSPGGLITKSDLAEYKAFWREPVIGDWHGYQVITAPPPALVVLRCYSYS